MPWTKLQADSVRWDYDSPVSGKERLTSYREAIREALSQALELDPKVFVMGEGVDDPGGVFGTTLNLHKDFGRNRVFDLPIAENTFTGIAVGAAISGMRPVLVHMRMDFMLLTMDQIVNHAAKWHYMFGGRQKVPLVIRSIIGRGWGSAAQHSQSLQGLFMHVPGLKLVMPSNAYDAKGLLLTSIADNNPVIFIEHRWLYDQKHHVPPEIYTVPFGKGVIKKEGKDATVVAISFMVPESLQAAKRLEEEGINIEVIDPRTLKPLDLELIINSVRKTGRLIVADMGWKTGGVSAELSALINENAFEYLKAPTLRVTLPDTPTPASPVLEKAFYPTSENIIKAVKSLLR